MTLIFTIILVAALWELSSAMLPLYVRLL